MPARVRSSPGKSVARILLILASVAAGCNGAPDAGVPLSSGIAFTDVSAEAGLASFRHVNGSEGTFWFPEQMGAGGGFVDLDGDGWEDIVLVGGGRLSPNGPEDIAAVRVYRNLRDGSFLDVTEPSGLASLRAYGTGVTAADYDNDGDQDIYITALGENLLLRNDTEAHHVGAFAFTEVGRAGGVAGLPVWSSSALFVDADNDGLADLYVAGYADWSRESDVDCYRNGEPDYCPPATYASATSQFYQNLGGGVFAERSESVGLHENPGKSLAVAEWDFDQDGYSDIVVVNDGQRDLLYMNSGNGSFTEVGVVSGTAFGEHGEARAGMGVDVGILDATGQPSIVVGNFSSEMIGVYRRTSSGWFIDRAAASRVGGGSLTTLAFGVLFLDADLDADLDVFVANGHVYLDPIDGAQYRQAPHLFMNNFDGTFDDVAGAVAGPLAATMVARSVSRADYDRDGDEDLLVTENNGPAHLLRNDSNPQRVLRVRAGSPSLTRDGLGTQVTVIAGDRRQVRRVRTGSGYLSQSEKTLTFGLGSSAVIDTMIVDWPDGTRDEYTAIGTDVELHLVHGQGIVGRRPVRTGPAPSATAK